MSQNDILALDANFKNWKASRFPNPKKGENPFEYYCIEQFIRAYDLGDSQIKAGLVGGGLDGGIDAFYVLANGELVDSETELVPNDPPSFKLVIMQIKSDEGFSPAAIDKLTWFADDLLDLGRKKAQYHSTYNDALLVLMRLFKDKMGVVVGETPPVSIEFIYVIKKDVTPNTDCGKSVTSLEKVCKKHFSQGEFSFHFVHAPEIWKQVQKRPPRKKTLRWAAQPMVTTEGHVGLVKLTDYYMFIREQNGALAERFFDSNVRGYWPTSGINKRIARTLEAADAPEFWIINNGITILTERLDSGGDFLDLDIHDPQIVNGLQTSRSIFNHFSTTASVTNDERRVMVRVIRTSDTKLRDAVIRATNSQNEMPEEALRATDEIHRQIETAFHNKSLYYDRRKGYYRDKGKPVDSIVGVVDLVQAMASIVLQRPDDARARPRDYVKKNEKYSEIFGKPKFSLSLYLKIIEVQRRTDDYIYQHESEAIHRRNLSFYLSMYAAYCATKSPYPDFGKLEKIDLALLTDIFLEDCLKRTKAQYNKIAQKGAVNGDVDFDAVGKGTQLVKALIADLKKRFP